MGGGGLLGRPHPAFGHPLPKGEGLSLGRNAATLSQGERGWNCLFPAMPDYFIRTGCPGF